MSKSKKQEFKLTMWKIVKAAAISLFEGNPESMQRFFALSCAVFASRTETRPLEKRAYYLSINYPDMLRPR